MSQEDSNQSTTDSLTAEFRDGQLQIVEVTPFDKNSDDDTETIQVETDGESPKYMQVYDNGGKGLLQLDLLNLTFVRCDGEDGDQYRLVANSESTEADGEFIGPDDTTVTCVLQSSDGDEQDGQESFVMVEGDQYQDTDPSSYVMVEGEQGNVILMQSEPQTSTVKKEDEKPQTTYEILERAKALRKAKRLLESSLRPQRGPGRRRRGTLPPAQELLSSPEFKLFLYSCKLCPFKCNAIRELTAHRSTTHGGAHTSKYRGTTRAAAAPLQCARCPYRAASQAKLMEHLKHHTRPHKSSEDAIAEAAPDSVLVCGACGFESASRPEFRAHIAQVHSTMVAESWTDADEK